MVKVNSSGKVRIGTKALPVRNATHTGRQVFTEEEYYLKIDHEYICNIHASRKIESISLSWNKLIKKHLSKGIIQNA
jgi:hypothetical protein